MRRRVSRLDRTDPSAAGVRVYRLQYAQAKTVASALNDLFGSGGSGGGSDIFLAPSVVAEQTYLVKLREAIKCRNLASEWDVGSTSAVQYSLSWCKGWNRTVPLEVLQTR